MKADALTTTPSGLPRGHMNTESGPTSNIYDPDELEGSMKRYKDPPMGNLNPPRLSKQSGDGGSKRSSERLSLLGVDLGIDLEVNPDAHSWIESSQADVCVGLLIALNCVIVGVETDFRPDASQPWSGTDIACKAVSLTHGGWMGCFCCFCWWW